MRILLIICLIRSCFFLTKATGGHERPLHTSLFLPRLSHDWFVSDNTQMIMVNVSLNHAGGMDVFASCLEGYLLAVGSATNGKLTVRPNPQERLFQKQVTISTQLGMIK
mmetsp:Transcript_10222/g.20619  ORF Transcript_10222/g.20619 Transcript_10222/m.20619 type:complete len:109 (-) Transcript_10222:206-532(-)